MAINVLQTHTTTGFKAPIMVSRHNDPQYTVAVTIGGGATYTLQGTISQLNRGETAQWFDFPSAIGLTADLFDKITESPLEAIRINVTAVTDILTFQLQQNT